jgi:hypothetical protein
MKDEALKLAIGKIKSARDCHFAAINPLLFEAEEILEQALAAQPEPDGWAISYDGKTPYAIWPEGDGPLLDLEVKRQGGTCCKLPIYTTPPAAQRKWVGLTDEELKDIELGCHKTLFGKIEAMQKVEAKLKEKNT